MLADLLLNLLVCVAVFFTFKTVYVVGIKSVMEITVSRDVTWEVTPCNLVEEYGFFRGNAGCMISVQFTL